MKGRTPRLARDILVVDVRQMAGDDGMTLVTWSTSGGVYDARVYFRSPATLHNPRVVAHEMMHSLGFGHTTAWGSIMNPGPRAPLSLTREDVAYAQYAFDSRASSEREDMWERLALADEREGSARARGAYADCTDFITDTFDGTTMTKMRGLVALGALSAISACSGGAEKNSDTSAAPVVTADTAMPAPVKDTSLATPAAAASGMPANVPGSAKPRPPVTPPLAPQKKQ